MKIIIKLIITAALLLFCDIKIIAQNDYQVDSVSERTGDLTSPETWGDTALNSVDFEMHPQEYKDDKDFAYMKYLDSLLRQTKNLTVDTFRIGNSPTARGERKTRQSPTEVNAPRNFFSQPVVKIILWVLAILLIGFIIYKLFLGENFFRSNRNFKSISDTHKEEEEISDPSGYDDLIAQAVLNKDYRLAIRYSYLQTLKKLAEMELLQFSVDKTNYQYVAELLGKPYQNDFAALTLNYEYVWYGKFDIKEDVYHRLAAEYRSFHKKI